MSRIGERRTVKPGRETQAGGRLPRLGMAGGMTLLELVAACAILMVLATVAIPLARVKIVSAREQTLRAHLKEIRDAIDRYKDASDKGLIQAQNGTEGYPPDLQTLVDGVDLTSAGAGQVPGVPVANQQQTPTNTGLGTSTAQTDNTKPPVLHLVFLRKEELVDPMTGTSEWGMRSAQDAPDSTDWGGQDVFDVFSKSSGTALDGTKYSDW